MTHNTGTILSLPTERREVFDVQRRDLRRTQIADGLGGASETVRGIVMRKWMVVGLTVLTALLGTLIARSFQSGPIRAIDEAILREYVGVYQWARNSFLYLQIWSELTGTNQLVAFDETGELRALYPAELDRFFTGPAAALPAPVESKIDIQRDDSGKIASLTWSREGTPARTARRVDIERREDVRFSNGNVQLAGTLISPTTQGPHPAVILVHASGAEDREHLLPFARFLIRHGIAVLGYDKRGVGASTGDWNQASFDDLAGDIVAAFEYLKSRNDIRRAEIGMLGWSQAGWVMPWPRRGRKTLLSSSASLARGCRAPRRRRPQQERCRPTLPERRGLREGYPF